MDSIAGALGQGIGKDSMMKGEDSDEQESIDSDGLPDLDEDMPLMQYLKDIKLGALAKRELTKGGSRYRKGQ